MTTPTPPTQAVRSREFLAPIDGASRGRLVLARGTADLIVAADPSLSDLLRATFRGPLPDVSVEPEATVVVRYPGTGPIQWLMQSWKARGDVALNPAVAWTLEFRGGVHRLHADLRALATFEGIEIRGGVGDAEIWMPPPRGTVPLLFAGNVSRATIHRPRGTPARLSIAGAIAALTFDADRFGSMGGGIRRETPDWIGSANRFEVSVLGNVSDLEITDV